MVSKKWTLKKLDVLSTAKIYTVIMAIVGLAVGFFIAIFGTAAGLMTGAALGPYAGLGLMSIIFLPIVLAIYGFILGAVGALLYNIVAGRIGGIKMEFEDK